MRKEVSIAIIIGIILGGVILYGINLANKSANSLKGQPTPTPTVSAVTSNPNPNISTPSSSLVITSHLAHQVVFEKEITLSGKATPLATISLISDETEEIFSAGETGLFSLKVSLVPGENKIQLDEVVSGTLKSSSIFPLVFSPQPIL